VHDRAPRRVAPPAEQRAVLDAFVTACRQGDLDGLLRLLAPDVVLRSDGGGAVRTARRPIEGADKVARFLLGLVRDVGDAEVVVDQVWVNGAAGMVVGVRPTGSDVVHRLGVQAFDISPDGRIERLWFVLNPAKLGHLPA
ncbi:MAG TPA: nuclear transport factor 2 family protein, partial [Cryptosporangiaceae bacterium]|nr:nuclear transport factor 2 family protein [Cryptosporangiaceae bacterium]